MQETSDEIQTRIIKAINDSGDCFSQYTYLLECATRLPAMSDEEKAAATLVDGCQSSVWLLSTCKDGLMEYRADSDTLLVKGILALMLDIYSHQTPHDIITTPVRFLAETELQDVLEQTRKDGLNAILDEIVLAAQRACTC